VHDSRGIEIVNLTISLALSAGTLMASAGTPYRLVPAHFYPWAYCSGGEGYSCRTQRITQTAVGRIELTILAMVDVQRFDHDQFITT